MVDNKIYEIKREFEQYETRYAMNMLTKDDLVKIRKNFFWNLCKIQKTLSDKMG